MGRAWEALGRIGKDWEESDVPSCSNVCQGVSNCGSLCQVVRSGAKVSRLCHVVPISAWLCQGVLGCAQLCQAVPGYAMGRIRRIGKELERNGKTLERNRKD